MHEKKVYDLRPCSARRRILDAARLLLRQHGYERFTMESVARQAGLTRRTVYNQFEGRDALYRASRLELLEAFEDALPVEVAPASEIGAAIERFFEAALAVLTGREHRELQASANRDGAAVSWLVNTYTNRVDRPLRQAVERYLLMHISGNERVDDRLIHAHYALVMLKTSAVGDGEPVFDAKELAAIFVSRLHSAAPDNARQHAAR